ncbi:MAG: LysR family transcriptional regulator [Hyphomicrobiales bacterium]|nr:LysR family transcriptional regulator [Hyphomicrobiales bacterium]MCP5000892.1 LysR family transcriptional regulator [Hyphomicrobiales bacterium]
MPTEFPNLRHLRAFKEVAERKSVSAAAIEIHLSQPAVTQAIAGLEKALALQLFDRKPEGMFVTPLGLDFLFRVQRIFLHLEEGAQLAVAAGRSSRKSNARFHKNVSASQLRALVAIRETGNFSLAARKLGVSQPSVYRAGRGLEELAGVPFFSVAPQGIELTQAAEHFARGVKLAASELKQGYDEITLSKGRDSTVVTIGSLPLSRTSILPEAINALLRRNSGVQVRTIEGPYDELLRSLRYGDLDCLIGALRSPAPAEELVEEHLFNDPLNLVVGPSHPLLEQEVVSFEDALAFPWIAPSKTTPTGSYLFHLAGIGNLETTPVRIVSSSLVLIRGLLARGDFVTIMSRHQMAVECERGLMVPLDIDLPDSARPIGLTFREGWHPTPTQSHFVDLIRDASCRESE